jgi:Phage integrase family
VSVSSARRRSTIMFRNIENFAKFLGRSLDSATGEDLRRYQVHQTESGVHPRALNSSVAASRFFFKITLGRADLATQLARIHYPRRLPRVLSPEDVNRLLEAAPGPGLKYKAALSVAYGAGLRASEVVALTVSDIDSKRMLIRVEQGQGPQGPARHALATAARSAARVTEASGTAERATALDMIEDNAKSRTTPSPAARWAATKTMTPPTSLLAASVPLWECRPSPDGTHRVTLKDPSGVGSPFGRVKSCAQAHCGCDIRRQKGQRGIVPRSAAAFSEAAAALVAGSSRAPRPCGRDTA